MTLRYIISLAGFICPLFIVAQCVGTSGQVSWHYWEDVDYYNIDYLYVDDTYPQGPDQVRTLTSIMTPKNYDNKYGAVTKGFISVPETSSVTFNLTADDETTFYLSSDASAGNLDSIAYVPNWTSIGEHDKYPEQTSRVISMSANQLYYFEIHHYEGGGGDHAAVYWQRPYVSDTTWQLITSPFLTDVCDPICPPKGSSCDDGDPSTTDDIEDGACNCVGTSSSMGAAIGERGLLDAYIYEDVTGGDIQDLLEDPDYPTMPDQLRIYHKGLEVEWDDDIFEFGLLMEGYLTAPASGCYDFNITGVAEVKFYLSTDESPQNAVDSIYTRWGTGRLTHDHPSFNGSQTMSDICLEKGKYYYFRLVQVTPSWGHHVSVFWNGPQHTDDGWHYIPEMLVYNYEDELACLPLGSTCDDGDHLTANDQIQSDCSCAGTPCTPQVDCDDPSANYAPYDYCETSDQLGTRADDAWISCDPSDNPYVAERSGRHWIHYDLGATYVISETRVWNYNVTGETNKGFSQVAVDYSSDGVTWYHLGDYSWPQASGSSNYQGFDGPNFQQVSARYIMFTSLDNPATCRGISKATFSISQCASRGTRCDDGRTDTFQDHIDEQCQCIGYSIDEMDCAIDTLYISQDDMAPATYHAISALMSQGRIIDGSDLHYKAGMEIVMRAGFEVEVGSLLDVEIADCPSNLYSGKDGQKLYAIAEKPVLIEAPRLPTNIEVYRLDERDDQTIHIYLEEPSHVVLDLYDELDKHISRIAELSYQNWGDHYKRVQTKKLDPGVYTVKMMIDGTEMHAARLIVD